MAEARKLDAARETSAVRIARPSSLTTLVVDRIRDMIVTERFALGEQLSENTLAAMLGVSRAPVRDAFVRLQAEGMVNVQPQRGTFVFTYDATELRNICELRQVLETGALRIACARDRQHLADALRARLDAVDAAGPLDPQQFQPFDTGFHDVLIAATHNSELIGAYGRIAGRIRAIRHRLTRLGVHVAESHRLHRAIAAAVEKGRDDEAESLLTQHVYASYRRLLDSGRAREDQPARPMRRKRRDQ